MDGVRSLLNSSESYPTANPLEGGNRLKWDPRPAHLHHLLPYATAIRMEGNPFSIWDARLRR
eukprot:9397441-Pyramimonas_sp.AAC.1